MFHLELEKSEATLQPDKEEEPEEHDEDDEDQPKKTRKRKRMSKSTKKEEIKIDPRNKYPDDPYVFLSCLLSYVGRSTGKPWFVDTDFRFRVVTAVGKYLILYPTVARVPRYKKFVMLDGGKLTLTWEDAALNHEYAVPRFRKEFAEATDEDKKLEG